MSKAEKQAERQLSTALTHQLLSFLDPLLKQLDHFIDKRLMRTLLGTVIAILLFGDRAKNLLLSALGAYLTSPAHAPAGTKRLSNLLRSVRWQGRLIQPVWRPWSVRERPRESCGMRVWWKSRRAGSWKGEARSVEA